MLVGLERIMRLHSSHALTCATRTDLRWPADQPRRVSTLPLEIVDVSVARVRRGFSAPVLSCFPAFASRLSTRLHRLFSFFRLRILIIPSTYPHALNGLHSFPRRDDRDAAGERASRSGDRRTSLLQGFGRLGQVVEASSWTSMVRHDSTGRCRESWHLRAVSSRTLLYGDELERAGADRSYIINVHRQLVGHETCSSVPGRLG